MLNKFDTKKNKKDIMDRKTEAVSIIGANTRRTRKKMINIYFKVRLLLILSICGLFFYPSDAVFPQRKHDSKIIFLQLRMKDDIITLVNMTIRPGYLKPQGTAGARGDILYDVTNMSGGSLWQGVSDNPSHRRLEYEDPDHPGKILSKVIDQNDVRFTIRIPYDPGIKTVSFYSLKESVAPLKIKQSSSILIGTIELQLDNLKGR